MIRRFLCVTALLSLSSSSAFAGPVLVTPPFPNSLVETLICGVTNGSTKKSIEVEIRTADVNGGSNCAPETRTIGSLGAAFYSCAGDDYCIVEVLSGGKKNARLVASVFEGGLVRAAVAGQ